MSHIYIELKKTGDQFGYKLFRRDDDKYCVCFYDLGSFQVYSCMPGDQPKGGGRWFARNTDAGIDYVCNGYSRSYAYRMFRFFSTENNYGISNG